MTIEKDQHETVVVFRKYKSGKFAGDIIAIFPGIKADATLGNCLSYEHIGQHGACDPTYLMNITTLADESEYASLKAELESIGYNLKVKKRIQYEDYHFAK